MEKPMTTRVVHSKLWKDEFFADLTASEKVAFLYFLTNERINVLHCYEVSSRELRFDTGLTDAQLHQAKEKFQQAGKMYFFNDWVFLKNASKYQKYEGETNDKAKEKIRETMNSETAHWFTQVSDTNFEPIDTNDESMYTPQRGSNNQQSVISNKKLQGESAERGISAASKPLEEAMQEIADFYQVPLSFVHSKWDDLENWCSSKGKRYKNYTSALRDWVKRDSIKIRKEDHVQRTKASIITGLE